MPYYAVANGRNNGIFMSWDECNNSIKEYKNAIYKKIDTEKESIDFIQKNNSNIDISRIQKMNKIQISDEDEISGIFN